MGLLLLILILLLLFGGGTWTYREQWGPAPYGVVGLLLVVLLVLILARAVAPGPVVWW